MEEFKKIINPKAEEIEQEEEKEEKTFMLDPVQMSQLLHILVSIVKGITIPQKTFDEYDKNVKINITYDEVNELWRIWVPTPPRKRGIVVPKKRIIH